MLNDTELIFSLLPTLSLEMKEESLACAQPCARGGGYQGGSTCGDLRRVPLPDT